MGAGKGYKININEIRELENIKSYETPKTNFFLRSTIISSA